MKELISKLNEIQKKLIAPKGQYNAFGKYKYRSCEDILEGVKPLLDDVVLIVSDDVVMVGDRYYIQATAKITDGENEISNTAFARESLTKKGMDDAQVTGSASSYARKIALSGLLLIDDNKDPDTQPPVKNDYKAIARMTEEITSLSAEKTKTYGREEKVEFMQRVLLVKNFNELSSKSESDLERIIENIKRYKS